MEPSTVETRVETRVEVEVETVGLENTTLNEGTCTWHQVEHEVERVCRAGKKQLSCDRNPWSPSHPPFCFLCFEMKPCSRSISPVKKKREENHSNSGT